MIFQRYILPFLIFIAALFLQILFVPFFSLGTFSPDLIILLIVFYTLKQGQIFGMIAGFIFGFAFDITSGGMLGSSMFSYALSGFIAGIFFNENKFYYYLKSFFFALIVIICTLINNTVYYLITEFTSDMNLVSLLFVQGIFPALYTAVIASLFSFFVPKGVEI